MADNIHDENLGSPDDDRGASTIAGSSVSPKLQVLRGDSIGKIHSLKFKTRAGRETDNDITIIDPMISRYHFQISFEEGKWILSDLGSVNGTKVNGLMVSIPQPLIHEDKIQLGETVLLFRDPTVEQQQEAAGMETSHGGRSAPVATQVETVTEANNRRLLWIIGGLILILILAISGLLIWLNRADGAISTNTTEATDTPQNFTILRTEPDPEQNLVLKYDEDFSDSFGGWDDAFGADFTKQYGNNRYHIEINTNNLVVWGLANRLATDFELEVEATREQGGDQNTYGLIFRYVDHSNYYRFDLSGDGFYLLSKFEGGVWSTLADWEYSDAIQQGESPVTVLKISAIGPEIKVSANGVELAQATDDSFSSGNFGFFASTFEDPNIWVSFDNLQLWSPENQEIALIPTPEPVQETPVAIAEVAATDTATAEPTATATSTATSTATASPTATPAEEQTQTITATVSTAISTPTATNTPTATATPTVEPTDEPTEVATLEATPTATDAPNQLPDFVSRDQPLARGEEALSGLIYFPIFDPNRGTYDIFRADPDGLNLTLIQPEASQVALNKAGTNMAYRSWQPDERGLFSRPVEGGDKWLFVKFFEAASPVFSENEDFFGFHSRQGGGPTSLYRTLGVEHDVLRRDGLPMQGEMMALTPDNRIVYRGCHGGTCGIVRSNLDGSFPQQLTGNADDTAPSISPDGQTIAFMSNESGNWDVYTMSIDGQNLRRLTTNPESDGIPSWSPDGRNIIFATNHDGPWSIWRMDPDGTHQRQMFVLPGSIDGIVKVDAQHSFGWLEERIAWRP